MSAPPISQETKACRAVLDLLAARAPEQTVCPSEVARTLAAAWGASTTSDAWRQVMPVVHGAIDAMMAQGEVTLSWARRPLARRAGPYRIGRPASSASEPAAPHRTIISRIDPRKPSAATT